MPLWVKIIFVVIGEAIFVASCGLINSLYENGQLIIAAHVLSIMIVPAIV